MGAFASDGADIAERTYTPKSRPDGHGIWVEDDSRVPFLLEYDTGTERPISRLVDKIDGYEDLARVTERVWPVLFWLPGPVRERHLHEELTDAGVHYPVATAIHDAGNPAEAVWWLHRRPGRRLRLAELSGHNLIAVAR